jgi:diguanylate cyclase (GGDEF)-like protein
MLEKILLVEDNKALAKLLAKKTEASLGLEVDVAHSMEEATTLLRENKENYFIALLDLNLPDAPDGEIVDYVLSQNILVIVLTGNIDKKTKALFAEKPIVDYVYKGNMDDVNYIFTMIDRLRKNRHYKVMVVDDSIPSRNRTKVMLQSQQFKVLAAAHGEEALRYFEDHDDIRLVVTDYHMPVVDGMELVLNLRKTHPKHLLGIIAITSNEDESVAAKFLKHGANDFIVKPFGKEELICRVNNTIEAQEKIETIANLVNIDPMTGALNRRYFFTEMEKYMQEATQNQESYMLGIVDIDHFKSINDTYGHDVGDKVIIAVAKRLQSEAKGLDLVSRLSGEEFGVVLKNISREKAVAWFVKMRANLANEPIEIDGRTIKITVSMGLASGVDLEFEELMEQADSALFEAKRDGRNRVEIAHFGG